MLTKRTCTIDDCTKPLNCRGMCSAHWTRWKRHGDPRAVVRERVDAGHTVCSILGCGRPHHSKGLCDKHAYRARQYGSPHKLQRLHDATPMERILHRLEVDLESGCWRYPTTRPDGYARVYVGGAVRATGAHRVAYEFWVGPIPDGHEIDHVWDAGCRHRNCVRPDHLEAVLPSVNSLRRERVKRLG